MLNWRDLNLIAQFIRCTLVVRLTSCISYRLWISLCCWFSNATIRIQHLVIMEAPANTLGLKQTPLTCNGHTRPIVHLDFSKITKTGFYFISASKGIPRGSNLSSNEFFCRWKTYAAKRRDWRLDRNIRRPQRCTSYCLTENYNSFSPGAIWGVVINDDATIAATASADFTAKVCETSFFRKVLSYCFRSGMPKAETRCAPSLTIMSWKVWISVPTIVCYWLVAMRKSFESSISPITLQVILLFSFLFQAY